jgi:putative transposase
VAVEVDAKPSAGTAALGIDLGLKECATTSTGEKLEGRWCRANEKALVAAQRAGKKQRARAIHAKIRNQRKDQMAKSTLDAGWASSKTMLEYKATQAGIVFKEINESYSTQTCSRCASIEGPKGLSGLGIRQWTCSCAAVHDRDVNAARNIAARGLASLEVGAPA